MACSIKVNGITYNGNNLKMINNKVIIDGVDVSPDSKIINVLVHGDVNNLSVDSANEIVVAGDCSQVNTSSGDVEVGGNVDYINTTSGDVKVDGDVMENVATTSGDIECSKVGGNASTRSGDIDKRL
jgi:lipopolysaccharide assembly outer membrane protein LptD (OstA)